MPLYEYICPAGHVHETTRSVEDRDRPVLCPETAGAPPRICGLPMARLISPPGCFPGADSWRKAK